MPITDAQREARRHVVGASDVFRLLSKQGLYDLWLEKTPEGVPPRLLEDERETDAMRLGNLLEQEVLRKASEWLIDEGRVVVGPPTMQHSTLPLAANLDALLQDHVTGRVLTDIEVKTAGVTGARSDYREVNGWRMGFGDPDAGEVGDAVIMQVHAQLMCLADTTGVQAAYAYVPAFVAGQRDGGPYRLYRVEFDGDICEWIAEEVQAFWESVKRGIPPADCAPPGLDTGKRMKRKPGKVTTIPFGLWQDLDTIRKAKNQLDRRSKALTARLHAAMGDAEYAVFPAREGAVRVNRLHIKEKAPREYDRVDLRFLKAGIPGVNEDD